MLSEYSRSPLASIPLMPLGMHQGKASPELGNWVTPIAEASWPAKQQESRHMTWGANAKGQRVNVEKRKTILYICV